jgi:hypothetical protein
LRSIFSMLFHPLFRSNPRLVPLDILRYKPFRSRSVTIIFERLRPPCVAVSIFPIPVWTMSRMVLRESVRSPGGEQSVFLSHMTYGTVGSRPEWCHDEIIPEFAHAPLTTGLWGSRRNLRSLEALNAMFVTTPQASPVNASPLGIIDFLVAGLQGDPGNG